MQQGKYWLSAYGLRYSLAQTATFVNLTDVMQGDNVLGFTFDLALKWTVFSAADSGPAGWISRKSKPSPASGLRATTNRRATTSAPHQPHRHMVQPRRLADSGTGMAAIASGTASRPGRRHGQPGQLLDVNAYANTGRGQFINSALIDSMVVPLANYNPG